MDEQNLELQDAPEDLPQDDAGVQIPQELPGQVVEEPTAIEEPAPQVEEDWKHKYEVLKGKYDSEVPRLLKEMKRLKREKQELATRLDLLEKMLLTRETSSAPPSRKEEEEEDEEVKKLKEEYPDIYRAIEKVLRKKIGTVENKVKDMTTQMTQQQFIAQLTAIVPEWQRLNTDPDFLDWLQEEDPSTGYTRHQLMLYAYNNGDVNGVARWFKKYLAEVENKPVEVTKKMAEATKNVSPPHRRQSRTGETPARVYKASEIRDFYTKVALGRISPEEQKKREEEYIRAILEGRVLLEK